MNVADPSEYKILKISEEYNVKLMHVKQFMHLVHVDDSFTKNICI